MRAKMITKRLAILAVLLLVLWIYPGDIIRGDDCDDDWDGERIEEKFQKTVELAKDGHVYLKNISGDIIVETWNQNSVKIEALKISRASTKARAKENMDLVKIEIDKVGNKLKIITDYAKRSRWTSRSMNVSVNYHLWIPDQASTDLNTVSGDIEAEGIGGLFEANAVSGDIDVKNSQEGVDISTVSGDLELDNITGDAELNTVSGEITLNRIQGSIEAETVSGEIELGDVSMAKEVEAKTVSGDISYDGDINPQGRYILKSHSGDVKMRIPADAGFDLEAKTFSGHIDCDLHITMYGRIKPRSIRGVVNDGGATLRLTTFSGSIEIEKR